MHSKEAAGGRYEKGECCLKRGRKHAGNKYVNDECCRQFRKLTRIMLQNTNKPDKESGNKWKNVQGYRRETGSIFGNKWKNVQVYRREPGSIFGNK